MQKRIFVSGSLAYDYIMDFPGNFADNIDPSKLHIINLSFLVTDLKKGAGGTAGNISYTLGLLKSSPKILSVAGNDFENHKKLLESVGTDTTHIKIIDTESTALAMIMTDKNDNQISAFYPGALNYSKDLNLDNLEADYFVISPDLPETMLKIAQFCQVKNISYMFDPGMQLPRLSDEELLRGIEGADVLVGNDYEIGLIKKRLKKEDKDLASTAKVLITTLGERGSRVKTASEDIEVIAAKPKEVVDPTGAGDAFRAGFIAGYLRGFGLKTSAQMGSVSACYAVEKYGTTNHKFSLEEFSNRYQENFQESLNLND